MSGSPEEPAAATGAEAEDVQLRVVADPEEMERAGAALGRQLRAGDLLVLSGPLGAGKTTFTRGLGRALGVREPITSPTFVLARTHPSLVGGPALVHVDAYRLADAAEVEDLDLDLAASVVVMEWGAPFAPALAEGWLELQIERPVGAADAAGGGEGAASATAAPTAPAREEPEPVEPRTLRLRRRGRFSRRIGW